jgi:hypothetical protein
MTVALRVLHICVFVGSTDEARLMQPLRARAERQARDCPEERPTNMGIASLWKADMNVSSSGGTRPPRHLLIISRYHPGLYEYVRARFAREDNVEVILDRRRGRDRRTLSGGTSVERREAADRRTRQHIDTALRMESMQFVTIGSSAAPPPNVQGGAY